MLQAIKAIQKHPEMGRKKYIRNPNQAAQAKEKEQLVQDILNYCARERTINDIAKKFKLLKDRVRIVIKELDSRKRVKIETRLCDGHHRKFIIKLVKKRIL